MQHIGWETAKDVAMGEIGPKGRDDIGEAKFLCGRIIGASLEQAENGVA